MTCSDNCRWSSSFNFMLDQMDDADSVILKVWLRERVEDYTFCVVPGGSAGNWESNRFNYPIMTVVW